MKFVWEKLCAVRPTVYFGLVGLTITSAAIAELAGDGWGWLFFGLVVLVMAGSLNESEFTERK